MPPWFFSKAIAQVSHPFSDSHNKQKNPHSLPRGPLNTCERVLHILKRFCVRCTEGLRDALPTQAFPQAFLWMLRDLRVRSWFHHLVPSDACIPPPRYLFARAVRVCRCVIRTGPARSWNKAIHFYLPTPMMDTQREQECLDKEWNIQISQRKHPSSHLLCTWTKSAAFGLTECRQIHHRGHAGLWAKCCVELVCTSDVLPIRSWALCARAGPLHAAGTGDISEWLPNLAAGGLEICRAWCVQPRHWKFWGKVLKVLLSTYPGLHPCVLTYCSALEGKWVILKPSEILITTAHWTNVACWKCLSTWPSAINEE